MNTPKPFRNTGPLKAFVLGCDPTAFEKGDKLKEIHKVFEVAFNLNKDLSYFRTIHKNLHYLNLSLSNVYVQNLVTEYQGNETFSNPEWQSIAEEFIIPRTEEFDKIDGDKKIPVFLTSDILFKVLVNKVPAGFKPKSHYTSDKAFYIKPEDNKLGRPLIPLYRHKDYSLERFPAYCARLIKEFDFKLYSADDKVVKMRLQSMAAKSFKTRLELYLFKQTIDVKHTPLEYDAFIKYNISNKLLERYTSEYWQFEKKHLIAGKTIAAIEQSVNELKKNNSDEFKVWEERYKADYSASKFSAEKLAGLLNKGKCEYCKISEYDILQLAEKRKLSKKNFRGWSLEIDRLNSNKEYTPDNCVLACYWCNNAKTDEFTFDEFKIIAVGIKDVWEKRLGNKLLNDH